MKITTTLIILILTVFKFNAQNVTIPDANFKNYLLNNSAINLNGDWEIQVSEANAFTGNLSCSGYSISDLTGIEYFTNITTLNCASNNLVSLDLSDNTSLTSLYCSNNYLSDLNLTQNLSLTHLSCNDNMLSRIDLNNNSALKFLHCQDNMIDSLDVTQNTLLIQLTCQDNMLTNVDVTQNTVLTYFHCANNFISNVDITQNPDLTIFSCYVNYITNLDLSQNLALELFNCRWNSIQSLDLSINTNLKYVYCQDNLLTCLNVANGNNHNFLVFFAQDNQNLSCIQVDDVVYSDTTWTFIDPNSSFSLACSPCPVLSTDAVVECQEYTWIDGVTYFSSNNSTSHTITGAAANGADSIIFLNLTIPTFDLGVSFSNSYITSEESNADSYQWYDCNSGLQIDGEVNNTFEPINNGSYAVIITKHNCVDTSNCLQVSSLKVEEIDHFSTIFPNPSNGEFNISSSTKMATIEIYNLDGKLVEKVILNDFKSNLNISDKKSGLYFVSIIFEDGQRTSRKVVKL